MASKSDRADEKSISVSHGVSHPLEPLDTTRGSWESNENKWKKQKLNLFFLFVSFVRFAVNVYVH